MTDFERLIIRDDAGGIVGRASPSPEVIGDFQRHFGVVLAPQHLGLLRHANGGGPTLNTYRAVGQREASYFITRFYFLDEHRAAEDNLWLAMARIEAFRPACFVLFAYDGFGNEYALDSTDGKAPVHFFDHEQRRWWLICDSFEAFLNGLELQPDLE